MIAMLTAAVNAIVPQPSYAELVAKEAKDKAAVTSKETAKLTELQAKSTEAREEARSAIVIIEQALKAALHKASIRIASETHKALVPLFVEYRTQPGRSVASKIAAVIKSANADSNEAQGAPIDHFVLLTSWVEALVANGEGEDLLGVFAHSSAYALGPVEAGSAVLRAATERSISEIEDALIALETGFDAAIRMSGRHEATDDAQAAFAELARHSHAGLRSAAVFEFEQKTGEARQAAWRSEYVAPSSVASTGGVDSAGKQWARSTVTLTGPAVVVDDEGNESVVERRDPHFDRIAERDVSFDLLNQ